jgi:hypothetical protein
MRDGYFTTVSDVNIKLELTALCASRNGYYFIPSRRKADILTCYLSWERAWLQRAQNYMYTSGNHKTQKKTQINIKQLQRPCVGLKEGM